MRSAGAVLGVLILVATAASAAADASPPPSDLDRFMSLQVQVSNLNEKVRQVETKLESRDPTVEKWMWGAFGVVGLALSVAWWRVKDLEKAELTARYEREAKVAIWKEFLQAVRPLAPDPQTAVNDFATRLEVASGAIREAGGRAEGALRAIDTRVNDLSPRVAELEKKIEAAAKSAAGTP